MSAGDHILAIRQSATSRLAWIHSDMRCTRSCRVCACASTVRLLSACKEKLANNPSAIAAAAAAVAYFCYDDHVDADCFYPATSVYVVSRSCGRDDAGGDHWLPGCRPRNRNGQEGHRICRRFRIPRRVSGL